MKDVASFPYPLPPFSFFLAELEKCIQEQDRLAQLFIKHVSSSFPLSAHPFRLPSPPPQPPPAPVLASENSFSLLLFLDLPSLLSLSELLPFL